MLERKRIQYNRHCAVERSSLSTAVSAHTRWGRHLVRELLAACQIFSDGMSNSLPRFLVDGCSSGKEREFRKLHTDR